MKKILLFLWQLPQHILGLLFKLYWNKNILSKEKHKSATIYWIKSKKFPGVSLGNYIFINNYLKRDVFVKDHEYGHTKQSKLLGPLYLLLIGLPSISRGGMALFKKLFTDKELTDINNWYYSGYPENWADDLGEVNRFNKSKKIKPNKEIKNNLITYDTRGLSGGGSKSFLIYNESDDDVYINVQIHADKKFNFIFFVGEGNEKTKNLTNKKIKTEKKYNDGIKEVFNLFLYPNKTHEIICGGDYSFELYVKVLYSRDKGKVKILNDIGEWEEK